VTQVKPIHAKTLLSSVKQPDEWFGLRYNLNLFRGCQHHCIYCDSRSECYQIADFDGEVLVKENAPDLLDRELSRKRIKGTIGTGSMNDPYMPIEAGQRLTRRILEIIARHSFPIHVITKGALVTRDLDLLTEIGRTYAAVSFTITTVDDELARKIEPGAPLPSQRLEAMRLLADAGIYTGISLMPILPWITDSPENLRAVLESVAGSGGKYALPALSVTLRNRQREYFYRQLDRHFPGLRQRYERAYGERYSCKPPGVNQLYALFFETCQKLGIKTRMECYQHPLASQPRLF